jgi:hypothetical protein
LESAADLRWLHKCRDDTCALSLICASPKIKATIGQKMHGYIRLMDETCKFGGNSFG